MGRKWFVRTEIALILLLSPIAAGAASRFAQSADLAPWPGDFGALDAGLAIDGNILVVLDSDDGAAYVYVKPADGWSGSIVPSARLAPSSDHFSSDTLSVAIAGDTVIVGDPDAEVNGSEGQGIVYVFVRPPGGWAGRLSESATLVASDGQAFSGLGTSVAIEAGTIVAGAPTRAPDGISGIVGGIYVFQTPADGWSGTLAEAALLLESSLSDGDQLGFSVAISDGVVVGGIFLTRTSHPYDIDSAGRLLVFRMPSGGWSGTVHEVAVLSASDGQQVDALGTSLAIDGTTIVAGAPSASVAGRQQAGAVYVFVEPASGWATSHETAKLTASLQTLDDNGSGERLGDSVAVAGDMVVAGAAGWAPSSNTHEFGAVYVFARPPAGWASEHEIQKLTTSDAAVNDSFGEAVAIGDGFIGALAPGKNFFKGAGYIFGSSSWRIPSPARALTPPRPSRTGGR